MIFLVTWSPDIVVDNLWHLVNLIPLRILIKRFQLLKLLHLLELSLSFHRKLLLSCIWRNTTFKVRSSDWNFYLLLWRSLQIEFLSWCCLLPCTPGACISSIRQLADQVLIKVKRHSQMVLDRLLELLKLVWFRLEMRLLVSLVLHDLVNQLLLLVYDDLCAHLLLVVLISSFKIYILLWLVLNLQSFLKVLLIPVTTQNYETIWNAVEGMLHD